MHHSRKHIIISVERSGTNYFLASMREFSNAGVYFEIFNAENIYGLNMYPDIQEDFKNRHGLEDASQDCLGLLTHRDNGPVRFHKELAAATIRAGFDFMTYKIFPNQLELSKVKLILDQPNTSVSFLMRNRLDREISFQKAMQLNEWRDYDTTDKKIIFDVEEFRANSISIDNWFRRIYDFVCAEGIPHDFWDYDNDIDLPLSTMMEKQYFSLKGLGIDTSFPENIDTPRLTKQDKTSNSLDKIANADEVEKWLSDNKLSDYAKETPLYRYISERDVDLDINVFEDMAS